MSWGYWVIIAISTAWPMLLYLLQGSSYALDITISREILVGIVIYYVTLGYGIFRSIIAARRYAAELEAIKHVIDRAETFKSDKKRIDTKEIEKHFAWLNAMPGKAEPIALMMFQQLLQQWEEVRRESDLTIQIFFKDLEPLKTPVREAQTFAIRIGILLTFVGLLYGLYPLGQAYNEGKFEISDVAILVIGMTGAFATSVAGLLSSLFIAVMAGYNEMQFNQITRLSRTVWIDVGKLLSKLESKTDLPSHLKSVENATKRLMSELKDQSRAIRNEVETASEVIAGQGKDMALAAGAMQNTVGFVKDLQAENENRNKALRDAMSSFAMFEGELPEAFETRLRAITDQLLNENKKERTEVQAKAAQLSTLLQDKAEISQKQLEAFNETLVSFNETITKMKEYEERLPLKINERLDGLAADIGSQIEAERSAVKKRVEEFEKVFDGQTELVLETQDKLGSLMQSLDSHMQQMSKSSIDLSKEMKGQAKFLAKSAKERSDKNQQGVRPVLVASAVFASIVSAELVIALLKSYGDQLIAVIAGQPEAGLDASSLGVSDDTDDATEKPAEQSLEKLENDGSITEKRDDNNNIEPPTEDSASSEASSSAKPADPPFFR